MARRSIADADADLADSAIIDGREAGDAALYIPVGNGERSPLEKDWAFSCACGAGMRSISSQLSDRVTQTGLQVFAISRDVFQLEDMSIVAGICNCEMTIHCIQSNGFDQDRTDLLLDSYETPFASDTQ